MNPLFLVIIPHRAPNSQNFTFITMEQAEKYAALYGGIIIEINYQLN